MADYSKLTKKELKEQIYLYKDTIYKQNRIYNMLLSDYKTLKDKLLEYGKGIVSDCCIKTTTDIYQENQQLKQQLHDLSKKIVKEIREDMSKRIMEKQIKWGDNIQIGFICNAINECLDAILKKFGGENDLR